MPAQLDASPGRLGKPLIHSILIREQLLDARALQHAREIRRDVGEARKIHLQLGGEPAAPKEMDVRGGEMAAASVLRLGPARSKARS